MRQAHTILRKPPRRDHGNIEQDPAKLSASLRELALEAHRLVRALEQSASCDGPGDRGAEQKLTEVHAKVVQLQRNLRANSLHDLANYVSTLRDRIEVWLI